MKEPNVFAISCRVLSCSLLWLPDFLSIFFIARKRQEMNIVRREEETRPSSPKSVEMMIMIVLMTS